MRRTALLAVLAVAAVCRATGTLVLHTSAGGLPSAKSSGPAPALPGKLLAPAGGALPPAPSPASAAGRASAPTVPALQCPPPAARRPIVRPGAAAGAARPR